MLATMRRRAPLRRPAPPSLALTFDDGPDPEWTPRLLDVLRREGVRATFFVIAPRAAAAPALIERTVGEGHRVELHCWDHRRHSEMTEGDVEQDVERGLSTLAGLGVRPRLWRTPWGVHAPFTEAVAARHGLQLVRWDADTHDWRGDHAAAMRRALGDGLVSGGVVLAHDGVGPGALREDCRETVALVAVIAAEARREHWRLGPLDAEGRPA